MIIGFSYKKRSIYSWLISWATASRWSHTFLLVKKLENDWLIIESTYHGGVRYDLLSKYIKTNKFDLEFIEIDASCNIEPIKPYLWTDYGKLQILSQAWSRFWKLGYTPIKNNTVCSEIVLRCLQGTERSKDFSDLDPDYVSPEDIYRRLKTLAYSSDCTKDIVNT